MESVEKKEEGVEGEGGLGQKFEILLLFFETVLRSIKYKTFFHTSQEAPRESFR